MIKLVAIDFDGVLLNDESQVTKKTKEVIEDAKKNGVHVVFTTGRGILGSQRVINEFGLPGTDSYIITSRGSHCYYLKDNSLFYSNEIPSEKGIHVFEFAEKMGLTCFGFTSDGRYVYNKMDKYVEKEQKIHVEHDGAVIDLKAEAEKGTNFTKIVVAGEDYKVKDVGAKIKEGKVKSLLDLIPLDLQDEYLEVIYKNTNKANPLKLICEKLGIQSDEVLVMGDNEDDLPLFAAFENSAAPKNARNFVKAEAKVVLGKDCNHDCVVAAFKKFKVK